jgi:DnaJ-class molecular chaperone
MFIAGLLLAAVLVVYLQIRWMGQKKREFRDPASGAFSRIIETQTMRVYCDNCEGAGLVRDPANLEDLQPCPVCFGVGTHFVRQINRRDVLCSRCRGLGRLPGEAFDQATICGLCEGRGVLMMDVAILKIPVQQAGCGHCGRRGVLRDPEDNNRLKLCPVCFGLGKRLVRRMDARDEFCPGCQGMGRVADAEAPEGRWCRRCGGRGLVALPDAEEAGIASESGGTYDVQ